jgi:hypothetical protein
MMRTDVRIFGASRRPRGGILPRIIEIEINPPVVCAKGAPALDVLMQVEER